MTRLEVLKAEKEQIKSLHCLSFGLIDDCIEWYDKEIEAIVIHGADNKFYGQQADGEYKSISLYEDGEPTEKTIYNSIKAMPNTVSLQADGDLISRQAVIDAFHHRFLQKGFEKDRWWNSTHVLAAIEGLPSVAIPPEHDACKDCKHKDKPEDQMPCLECTHNYTDKWEREKPTDTITMTREEFSEKLMEHYRQGRADEKAYQNGEIMQSFNPD